MPFYLKQTDLVHCPADAVVNAANEELRQGGGICGAIFAASDARKLTNACRAIGHCPTGSAVITESFGLPAPYIIHTVGPVYRDGRHGEEALLRSCYQSSLRLAAEKGLRSVAFPLISGGIFGYPQAEAMRVAIEEIEAFLRTQEDMTVTMAVLDRSIYQTGQNLLAQIG